jgi:general secretion pathway protein N
MLPSAGKTVRQGAALVLVAGVVALGLIGSLILVPTGSVHEPSPLVAIDPTARVVDASVEPAVVKSAGRYDAAQGSNPLWSLPLNSLAITLERPIFSPSRRPPLPPAIAAPYVPPASPTRPSGPLEPDHPLLTLLGTLAGDRQGVGIFVDEANNSMLRVRTGEDHQGWILRSVRSREAIFEKGNRTATLALPPLGSTAQTPASQMSLAIAWRDGDGQMISAPARREAETASSKTARPRNTWLDGDGQLISAPPTSPSYPPAAAPTAVVPAM